MWFQSCGSMCVLFGANFKWFQMPMCYHVLSFRQCFNEKGSWRWSLLSPPGWKQFVRPVGLRMPSRLGKKDGWLGRWVAQQSRIERRRRRRRNRSNVHTCGLYLLFMVLLFLKVPSLKSLCQAAQTLEMLEDTAERLITSTIGSTIQHRHHLY